MRHRDDTHVRRSGHGKNETAVSLHVNFDSTKSLAAAEPIVVPANEENVDRLRAVLATMAAG